MKKRLIGFTAVSVLACLAGCSAELTTGEDLNVTQKGAVELTAVLVEIPGEFPSNDLYDYAFVMKYKVLKVHRGSINGDTVYVGHYNPLKPRSTAKDARVNDIGGNLRQFKAGDVHRMALDAPIDEHFMGGIVNRYSDQKTVPVYWAVWSNRVAAR